MGLGWQMMVALLIGFVSKENTIATLGVLYDAGEGARMSEVLSGVLTRLPLWLSWRSRCCSSPAWPLWPPSDRRQTHGGGPV